MGSIVHETVIDDIVSVLKDGVEYADGVSLSRHTSKSIAKYSSNTKAASELTLVTPVVCSTSISKDSAMMITKALERRNVSMYQMLFSAFSITNATDAITHLKQFHTNLDFDKMNLDNFIDTMDTMHEAVQYSYLSPSTASAIYEQYIAGLSKIPDTDINESSIDRFREVSTYGKTEIVALQEAPRARELGGAPTSSYGSNMGAAYVSTDYGNGNFGYELKTPGDKGYSDWVNQQKLYDQRKSNDDSFNQTQADFNYRQTHDAEQDDYRAQKDKHDFGYRKEKDSRDEKYRSTKDYKDYTYKSEKDKRDELYRSEKDRRTEDMAYNKMRQQASQSRQQAIVQQLLPSDVKKANEMQPSLMIVNFYCNDKDRDLNIAQQFVCGVKCKLYPVDSDTITGKIITKKVNGDVLLSLIRVTTGEISFAKDFLLAIDDAKIDTIARSKRKSGTAIFRALENRSLKSKLRKGLRTGNYYKNIAALVISQEEVEQLQKYNNVNVVDPKVIVPIMDQLSLLYFVIVDETSESVQLLISGSTEYETYTFSSLERESGDSNYKKIVNLMTRVAR